jgi:hypothetical protein
MQRSYLWRDANLNISEVHGHWCEGCGSTGTLNPVSCVFSLSCPHEDSHTVQAADRHSSAATSLRSPAPCRKAPKRVSRIGAVGSSQHGSIAGTECIALAGAECIALCCGRGSGCRRCRFPR